jgi:hypothetical protein
MELESGGSGEGGQRGVYDGEEIASGVLSINDKLIALRLQAMKCRLHEDHDEEILGLNDNPLMKEVVNLFMRTGKEIRKDNYESNLDSVLSLLEEDSLLAGIIWLYSYINVYIYIYVFIWLYIYIYIYGR